MTRQNGPWSQRFREFSTVFRRAFIAIFAQSPRLAVGCQLFREDGMALRQQVLSSFRQALNQF